MVRLGSTSTEDPSRAVKYLGLGRSLHRNAKELDVISETKYGNGMAIIAIHAAIAYTDALTIAFRGVRSQDGDHARASDVLGHALGQQSGCAPQVRRLRGILQAKSDISYSGQYYTLEEGKRILRETTTFIEWAGDMLANRPTQAVRGVDVLRDPDRPATTTDMSGPPIPRVTRPVRSLEGARVPRN